MSAGGRVLALLDVENLLPDAPHGAAGEDYAAAVERAAQVAGLDEDTHLVMGFGRNATGVFGARRAWPGAAIRCQRGQDGGERALLRHGADLAAVARCYDKVVIGSGDGLFTPYATALNSAGIHTMVVSWPDKLSRRLRLAATEVRLLTSEATTATEARHAA